MTDLPHVLDVLYQTLQDRKSADPDVSYVAQLYQRGVQKISAKVGEEATELVIAAMDLDGRTDDTARRDDFKAEAADLLFHVLVLLSHYDVPPEEVLDILRSRVGVGGLVEKAARTAD